MTAIDPDDIRVGDTVQRTSVGRPFVVSEVTTHCIGGVGAAYPSKRSGGGCETVTWELIDRPVPKPAVGSKWISENRYYRLIFDGDAFVVWWRKDQTGWKVGHRMTFFPELLNNCYFPDTDA